MIWRRDDAAAPEPPAPPQPREGGVTDQGTGTADATIVGQAARLEGTLVSAGALRVDGKVKGKINADGDVTLSPSAQVEADIRAENVTVAGRFKGNVTAAGRAEIQRGGRVDGNITAKSLVVAEGAVFNGQSIMDQQATAPEGSDAKPAPAPARRAPETRAAASPAGT